MPDDNTQQTSQSSQGGETQSTSTSAAGSGGGSSQTQASGGQTSQQATTQQAAAPTRPDYVPEQFWDATAGKVKDKEFGEHYSQIAVRDAAEQVRRAALPKLEEYKTTTTAAFKPPEGVEFAVNEADPLWSQARGWANKHGLSQDAFSEAIDLFAGAKVGEASTIKAAREAEIGKLGAAGTARVTALNTFFDGIGAPEMKQMLVTAGIIQAAEKLVSKFASQGSASFSQAHRTPNEPAGKVNDEQWAKMSPREKQEYSQRHDQSQFTRAN